MQHGFVNRGMDAYAAHSQALRALSGLVAREASTLAFERLFLLAGIAFLVVLPLLLFLKVARTASPASVPTQHADL
jgi:hypothetical protein